MISWVVGRGLLGSNVEAVLHRQGPVWVTPAPLTWRDPELVRTQLGDACLQFAAAAAGDSWQVAWCAGAGVPMTSDDELGAELVTFEEFLAALAAAMRPGRQRGALFLASSAGGVYAGSHDGPFTEDTPPVPTSAYGRRKLEQEWTARRWSDANGHRVLIGRIANLYGPGQDLAKPQGLISQVVMAGLLRQPTVLYVPLDTQRHFLYATDCADLVAAGLDRLRRHVAPTPVVTKLLASPHAVTVASVLGEIRRVLRHQPRLVLAGSRLPSSQSDHLRLRSTVWPDLGARPQVTLGEGVRAVVLDIESRLIRTGRTLTTADGGRR